MSPACCNRRSAPSLQPLGKVIPTIRQTYPRLCPTLPKALGTCVQNYRLIVLMFAGINPHVRGHKLRTSLATLYYVVFCAWGVWGLHAKFVIYISAFSSFISSAVSPVISMIDASSIPFASIFLAISRLRRDMPSSMPSALPFSIPFSIPSSIPF